MLLIKVNIYVIAPCIHCKLHLHTHTIILLHLIQEHDIPETVNLQVVCGGQVIASTKFTYYASAQYDSDLMFQYPMQTFPSYFPDVGGADGGQMLQVTCIIPIVNPFDVCTIV